jgi:hypothetical protein
MHSDELSNTSNGLSKSSRLLSPSMSHPSLVLTPAAFYLNTSLLECLDSRFSFQVGPIPVLSLEQETSQQTLR